MYNSTAFNKVKNVQETLDSNYTTSQLLTTLDNLLFRAIDLIIDHTDWLDFFLGQVITWYGDDSKRRLSVLEKDRVLELLFLFITCESSEEKKRIVRNIELERSIWFGACRLFMERSKPAFSHVSSADLFGYDLTVHRLRVGLMARADGDLYVAHRDVSYWHGEATRFKKMIMEKYMRHATNQANSFYRPRSATVDLEDLLQNLIVAVSRGIDKCSANKGTLTTVINFQIRSMLNTNQHGHEYGLAYTVPPNVKEKLAKGEGAPNFGVSLDSEEALAIAVDGPDSKVERYDHILHLRRLAKYADPNGIGRMSLDIQEILNVEETALVKSMT